jgi:hypothetical protein
VSVGARPCRRQGPSAGNVSARVPGHRRLLERTRDELLEVWRENLAGDEPAEQRIPRAVDAWAAYVQEHPYVPRMFFAEPSGDTEIEAIHRDVRAQASAALGLIVGRQPGGADSPDGIVHPEIPREQIVATALNVLWIGLERVRRGEAWTP